LRRAPPNCHNCLKRGVFRAIENEAGMTNFKKTLAVLAGTIAIAAAPAIAQDASQIEGPLVTADWLAENLNNPNVRVFEVSVDTGVYERGHIPGAVNLNWHTDLVDTVRRDIVSSDGLEAILRQAGVDEDTTIVLYGDNNNWFAAWGAWVFDIHGLDDVKLLDGGRKLWEAEGLPLDTAAPEYAASEIDLPEEPADLRAASRRRPGRGRRRRGRRHRRHPRPTRVQRRDLRPRWRAGAFGPRRPRSGRRQLPVGQDAVNEDGTFKSPDELQARSTPSSASTARVPVITYCRIGERSSHTWFALKPHPRLRRAQL
jgi:thiosulfate/3-mercaptopyruvate sulfurtransferase